MRIKTILVIAVVFYAAAIFLLTGCGLFSRTVYVTEGQAVRLRQEVRNVKIWVKTEDGTIEPGKATLREGWFCLPSDGEGN